MPVMDSSNHPGPVTMTGQVTAQVLRVTQSPMNPKQWCLDLNCGHEVWVTAKSRPSRKTMKCPHQVHTQGAA